MNGEQKALVMVVMTVATVIGWGVWNLATYHEAARALEASSRPSPEAVLDCVDQCALACAGEVMLEDAE